MDYRRVKDEDFPKIKELLRRHGVDYDTKRRATIGFVAVGDSGELIGVIFAHTCMLIEPFVCENPTAGVKLNYMMEGAISMMGVTNTIGHIKSTNEKLELEMKRAGYEEILQDGYKVFKKVI